MAHSLPIRVLHPYSNHNDWMTTWPNQRPSIWSDLISCYERVFPFSQISKGYILVVSFPNKLRTCLSDKEKPILRMSLETPSLPIPKADPTVDDFGFKKIPLILLKVIWVGVLSLTANRFLTNKRMMSFSKVLQTIVQCLFLILDNYQIIMKQDQMKWSESLKISQFSFQ